jgi:hypothetical protein
MGKKIIKLTESELYNLVKKVLQEQEQKDSSFYRIDGEAFKVINGQLYHAKVDYETGDVKLVANFNGNVNDFKVIPDLNTGGGTVVGDEFNKNVALATKNWPDLIRSNNSSLQYKSIPFPVYMIIPKPNNPLDKLKLKGNEDRIGTPSVFSISIGQYDKRLADLYKKSTDGTISFDTYIKSGRYIYLLQTSPSDYITEHLRFGKDEPIEDTVELNIESPFKFNEVNLTDEAQKEFIDFIKSIKTNYSDATGDVEVISSASIDGDPEGKVASGKTRKVYDMELSKKRAETIVSTLKNNLPGIKLNFIPNGIGQTDQFAPGKKWPEVTNQDETAPNRRLIIKLPQITKKGS